MRGIAVASLVLCMVGCAGKRPTPPPWSIATAAVEPTDPIASIEPPTATQPATTAPPWPATTSVPVRTPSPTRPADLARVATAERNDIRIRIELQRNPLPAGEVTWAEFTVTNAGRTNVRWLHDGCASIAGAYGKSAAAWPMGRDHEGNAALFKAYALGGHIAEDPSPFATFSFVPRERLGKGGFGCADIGIEEVIEPGESRRQTRWWSGFDSQNRSLPPEGPATLSVQAGLYWRGSERPSIPEATIRLEVLTWIVAADEDLRPSPAEIVDAALGDPGFAAFLETQAIADGREAIAWYRADRGVWEVGLLIWYDFGTPRIKGVLVDPLTRDVVGPLDRGWDRDADGFP